MNMTTEDVRVLREHFATSLTLDQFVPLLKKTLHDRIHDEVTHSLPSCCCMDFGSDHDGMKSS